jgi:hypothetical protein
MAKPRRSPVHAPAFPEPDFNQQLYLALKQSPWWMLSLAAHVLAFLVLSLFSSTEAAPEVRPPIRVNQQADTVDPDLEQPEAPEDTPKPEEFLAEVPALLDQEVSNEVTTDNNLDFNEPFGEAEGLSNAPFDGPRHNADIGLDGNAGSQLKGRGDRKDKGGRQGPGGKRFDDAVEDALRWLAAHQSPGGAWEAANFPNWCDGQAVGDDSRMPDGRGKGLYDVGVTGLALCAFLGAGYTSRGQHPFARTVARGLAWLRTVQDPEGCFGPRATQQYIYNHATAALAMVEAYGMTDSSIFKGSAQKALDFIALSRNPYFAWRYGIKPGDNDTSVTGWMMMALKSAMLVNQDARIANRPLPLVVDEGAFDGIRTWLDKVTDPDTGRVGYTTRGTGPARPSELVDRFPGEKSESMTAVGVLARIFMHDDPRKSRPIQQGAALCRRLPPVWNPSDGSIDMYYWYYATLAMYQVGGAAWEEWKAGLEKAVVETQRKDTDFCLYKGSWDPVGPWGADGGRVYSTALLAMCLQVYYRYERVVGTR